MRVRKDIVASSMGCADAASSRYRTATGPLPRPERRRGSRSPVLQALKSRRRDLALLDRALVGLAVAAPDGRAERAPWHQPRDGCGDEAEAGADEEGGGVGAR